MPRLPTGTLTFMFTDIEGSTRLLQTLGEQFTAVLDRHAEILRGAVGAHEGVEVNTEGDAFFAVFSSASEAVAAAVEAQRDLAAQAWPGAAPVRVRIGLHTGEGRFGGEDYVGMDVHRAARVSAAGHGGQVLLTDATRALVAGRLPAGVDIRDLGQHRLKDLPGPEHLFQLAIRGLESSFPALRSHGAGSTNLPPSLSRFIGRAAELSDIRRLLPEARLLTLTGPGGVGKTRLAIEAARPLTDDYPDGVFLVRLEEATDRPGVATAIIGELRLREELQRNLEDLLLDHVAERTLLLVLDNLEQVADGPPFVAALLGRADSLRILATSRTPLHIAAEHEYPVGPLGLPGAAESAGPRDIASSDAVALFVDRAQAADPTFALTKENADAVAAICRRLDGLPLAIELVAARLKVLAPQAILSRLERGMLVTGPARSDLPDRQRTLRATIDWSHELLSPAERAVFARTAVFAGGFTLDGVDRVCDPASLGIDALEVVGSLVDNSLIRPDRTSQDAGQPRFTMLGVIREYAADRLAEDADAANVARRHAELYLDFAEEAETHLEDPAHAVWLATFGRELDNIRAALEWAAESGAHELALRILAATWRFWHERGLLGEARRRLDGMLAAPGATAPTRIRARALTALGGVAYWQGDASVMSACYAEALSIARRIGDERLTADAMRNVGYVLLVAGDLDRAADRFREAIGAAERLGDAVAIATATGDLGFTEYRRGNHDEAILLLTRAIDIHRRSGRTGRYAHNVDWLAEVHLARGRLEEAAQAMRESLAYYAESEDLSRIGLSLKALAAVAVRTGRVERGARLAAAGARVAELAGSRLPGTVSTIGEPLDEARSLLSPGTYQVAVEEGRAMSPQEAVAYAAREDPGGG